MTTIFPFSLSTSVLIFFHRIILIIIISIKCLHIPYLPKIDSMSYFSHYSTFISIRIIFNVYVRISKFQKNNKYLPKNNKLQATSCKLKASISMFFNVHVQCSLLNIINEQMNTRKFENKRERKR